MGRSPLIMLRTHISFPPETLGRIDKIVGPKGRAEFVSQAVARALDAYESAEKIKADAKRREK